MNAQAVISPNTNIIDLTRINQLYIPVSTSKILPIKKKSRAGEARTTDKIQHWGKSADSIRSRDNFNNLILTLLLKGDIYKATLLIFGCNTGYRAGDILSFRVKDFMDEKEQIREYITLMEDKTNKLRTVWLNDTVRKILKFLIDYKHLTSENYIFRGDGNRKSYIDHIEYVQNIIYDEEDRPIGVSTTRDKYDEYGQIREVYDVVTVKQNKGESKYNSDGTTKEIAPMLVSSVGRFLKQICGQIGIEGKYSSHTMRQTYAYFISQDWTDNRYIQAICYDFGHSTGKITLEHYAGIDPEELKQHQIKLNLGKEAVDMYIAEYCEIENEFRKGDCKLCY